MIPRYAKPTKSTNLHTFTNRDQDLIKQGFRAGNFTFLAKFPRKIAPFGITAALKTQSKRVIAEKPRSLSVRKASSHFEWMPDNYNRKQEFIRKLRADSVTKQRAISKRDFINSGTPSRLQDRSTSKSSYVSINSSFSSGVDQAARVKWINDVQVKHGNFRMGRSLDMNHNKANAQEMITAIKRKIARDWESTDFDIGLNTSSCIEIRFHLSTLESSEAMHYYMGVLINKNQEIGKYCLKKLQSKWGVKLGKFLVFVLAPAWVRVPPSRAFLSMDGRKGFANQSVLKKRGSVWSNPVTHISTRDSSISIR